MFKKKKLYVFCSGMGVATRGLQESVGEYKGVVGKFEVIGAIDIDPLACQDHEMLTGFRPTCRDLFTYNDYCMFHGHEPPEDWREMTAWDIRESSGWECPDVVFSSPPCKGFTGLLPKAKAESAKYQALNNLVLRNIDLALEAWGNDPPAVFLIENVPGITSRGASLLKKIEQKFKEAGYVSHLGGHNCGEIGGLGQDRKRFLGMFRNVNKMPNLIYRPPRYKMKSIGDVIGSLPFPDDPDCGPMHRSPRLFFITWKRLSVIKPGKDHRYLQEASSHDYYIIPWDLACGNIASGNTPLDGYAGMGNIRLGCELRGGAMGVADWTKPSNSVTGSARVCGSNGMAAIGDVRLGQKDAYSNVHKVTEWDKPSGTVTAATRPIAGGMSVGDIRLKPRDSRHPAVYKIVEFDKNTPCVTGTRFGSGALAVGDMRLLDKDGRYNNKFKVLDMKKPATTVTGIQDVQAGAQSIGDPRLNLSKNAHANLMRVTPFDRPSGAVTGATRPAGGALSVAVPVTGKKHRNGVYGVNDWNDPSKAVLGCLDVHCGTAAVGDPRATPDYGMEWRIPGDKERGVFVIISPWNTWNRPCTTYELAALQTIPLIMPGGSPLVLAGKSDAAWRDRIGNAVPRLAAKAIGEQILDSILVADAGDWTLGSTGVWVIGGHEDFRNDCYGFFPGQPTGLRCHNRQ